MRIHVATDHAGLEFSQQLQEHLRDQGHEVVDHGPAEYDALDDYPSFCINAAQAVANDWAMASMKVDAPGTAENVTVVIERNVSGPVVRSRATS